MSNGDDRDTLMDLFSTRARGGTSHGESESLGDSGTMSVSRREGGRQTTGARVTLSPIANAVLRETRRELGSQEGGMDESRDVSEEAIAKAIDRVCASRGFVIDDIVRADIIVHLKRDLLGWGVLQPLISVS